MTKFTLFIATLCFLSSGHLFATENQLPAVKGLEQMIKDGDFDNFKNLSRYSFDFGLGDVSEGKFVKVDIENEDYLNEAFNNRRDDQCDCTYEDTVLEGTEHIKSYVEAAYMAELLRSRIETPQNIGHLEAGFYIGSVAGFACEQGEIPLFQIENKKIARAACAIAAATLAGIGKEIYDSFYPESHTVDPRDAMATALGGVVHLNVIELRW